MKKCDIKRLNAAKIELEQWFEKYFPHSIDSIQGVIVKEYGRRGFQLLFLDEDGKADADKKIRTYDRLENRTLLIDSLLAQARYMISNGQSIRSIYKELKIENKTGYSRRHFSRLIKQHNNK